MICPYLKKTLFTLGHYTKLEEPKSPYLGTFICVDQLMKAVDSKQSCEVDVFHTVYQLRRDRRYMVQTRAQYEFVYRSVIQYSGDLDPFRIRIILPDTDPECFP